MRSTESSSADSASPSDDAFNDLFRREYTPMVRMAALLVGSPSLAEEIVQESAITVRERWSSIDQPGAYLRATVVNGCTATLRRRGLEQRLRPTLATADIEQFPSEVLELRQALESLNDRQRTVVVLRYFVDIHDDEIAALLDAKPSTVRSLARRALATLRKELK